MNEAGSESERQAELDMEEINRTNIRGYIMLTRLLNRDTGHLPGQRQCQRCSGKDRANESSVKLRTDYYSFCPYRLFQRNIHVFVPCVEYLEILILDKERCWNRYAPEVV